MIVTTVEASTCSFISSLFSLAPSGQKKKKKLGGLQKGPPHGLRPQFLDVQ